MKSPSRLTGARRYLHMDQKYKKMILKMKEKEARGKKRRREKWFLYVLRCEDGTFYTGIAKDIEARIKKHNDGKGARYTRTRRPVELVYQETCKSRSDALVRECVVKAIGRKRKEALVLSG